MSSDPLDRRLRQLMGEVAAAAPEPPQLTNAQAPRPPARRRRAVLAAAAAAVAVVLAGAVVMATNTDDSDVMVTAGDLTGPSLAEPTQASIDEPLPPCPAGYDEIDSNDDGTIDVCTPAAGPTSTPNSSSGTDPADLIAAEQARIEAQQAAAREQARIGAEDASQLEARIAEAQAIWESAAIGEYHLRYATRATTETGIADVVITVSVENGQAIPRTIDTEGVRFLPGWTIDALFDLLATADIVFEAEFDPVLGYPTVIHVDPDESVADDEIQVIVTELWSREQIETAAQDLEAWFAASTGFLVEMPTELQDLLDRRAITRPSEVGDTYLLHDTAGIEVYVYRSDRDMCLAVAEAAPESAASRYGSISAGCQSETQFALNGDWTARATDTGEPTYLVVVPPARYVDATWDVNVFDVQEHSGERTTVSNIVLFEPSEQDEVARVVISCGCGDLSYPVPLRPTVGEPPPSD